LVENCEIFILNLYLAPPQGVTPSEFREDVYAGITKMIGLPYGEKNYDDMLSRFHLIPERHGQTDRQTDGRTNGQTELLYQYRASVCCHAIEIDMTSCFRSRWCDLVEIRQPDAKKRTDCGNITDVETGSRIPIWRTFVFPKRK